MEKFYTYDNKTDIEKCLTCSRAECINCLGNFYSANDTDEHDNDTETDGEQ